jgi:hypothetical protein
MIHRLLYVSESFRFREGEKAVAAMGRMGMLKRTKHRLFTVVMDFEGTTSVSQFVARSPREAMTRWAADLSKPDSYALTDGQRARLLRGFEDGEHYRDVGFHSPVRLLGLQNAWCSTVSCIRKGMALLNIIETNPGWVRKAPSRQKRLAGA